MNGEVTRSVACWLAAALLGLWAAGARAQAGQECGDPWSNTIGPFDYTNPIHQAKNIEVVERYHFTQGVENLTKGATSAYVMEDLDYTLRAIPNHHRALYSVARYELQRGTPDPMFRSADCWFERAIRFKPDDPTVRLIYGIFKARRGDPQAALGEYKTALEIDPNSAEAHYNLGLLYFDLKRYDEARVHAAEAYKRNYPLLGLRNKLARLDAESASKATAPKKPAPAPASRNPTAPRTSQPKATVSAPVSR